MIADHPTQAVLLQFLQQSLESEQARAVDTHVGSCADCERSLARLSGGLPWPFPSRPSVQIPGYEILEELGRGGMGVVYKARQIQLGRLVALKTIQSGMGGDEERRRRFQLEAEAVARIEHPNIVRLYDVGEHEGLPYLVLEFIDGESLADRLDGKPWPALRSAQLVEDLARTIHETHLHGIVHRDLKPSNVLMPKSQSGPKVTDFGLAKFLDREARDTQSGQILGTPHYMASEQAAGQNDRIGPATDVYALGAILYELLTGQPPYQGESLLSVLERMRHGEPVSPRQLQSGIPRNLETVCLKCLSREPEKRYSSALALAEDLRRWRQREPITARRPGWGKRLLLWARRRPATALAALFLVLLVAVVGAAASFLGQRPEAGRVRNRTILGHWLGTLRTGLALKGGEDNIRFIVKFTRQADGSCTGTFASDQDRKELEIDVVQFEGSSLRFEIKKLSAVYEGRLKEDGLELIGQWMQRGATLDLTFRRQEREPTFVRAQEPRRPFAYREAEVVCENPKAEVKLAGTLTLPKGPGQFPAVVLLAGWGPHDRDKTLFGHKPFLVIADHLTRRGIAVLRLDNRGVGGSSGSAARATMADFVEDVLAGVAYLKSRMEIDPTRIGLIDNAMRLALAPVAAAQSRDVAFVVLLASTGSTGEESLHRQIDLILQDAGADEKKRAGVKRLYEHLFPVVKQHQDDGAAFKQLEEVWEKEQLARLMKEADLPDTKEFLWTVFLELLPRRERFFLSHDPLPDLRKVPCPVLVLLGEKDRLNPPKENLPKIAEALREGGNKDYTIEELSGLNQLFQTCKTGHQSEYSEIEETFAPTALDRIGEWIVKRFGSELSTPARK